MIRPRFHAGGPPMFRSPPMTLVQLQPQPIEDQQVPEAQGEAIKNEERSEPQIPAIGTQPQIDQASFYKQEL